MMIFHSNFSRKYLEPLKSGFFIDMLFHIPFQKQVIRHHRLVLFLFSLLVACILNFINLHTLAEVTPEKVRLGETVLTSDDLVYLKPVKNFTESGVWTDGSIGRQQYFSRPPGYSLFILPFYVLFGLKKGLFVLKCVQLVVFSLSTLCLFHCVESLVHTRRLAYVIALLYGVFPIASGFVFYTLTEAVSPAILIFHLYYLQKGWRYRATSSFVKAACFLAYLFLLRPVLGMFLLPFSVLIFTAVGHDVSIQKRLQKTILFLSIVLLPITIWEIRVIRICREFPGLYPIYDKEVSTIYRPTHKAIWEFGKCWGISGKEFHEHIGPIWEQVMYPDSIHGNPIRAFISCIPKDIVQEVGVIKIQNAFLAYQANVQLQKNYFTANKLLPDSFRKQEKQVVAMFSHVTKAYKSKHWFKYHVLVPLHYLKEMSFHSNLNLYVYQHTWRGNIGMEGIRILSLLVHVGVFILLFCSFLVRNLSLFTRLLAFSSLLYILFLAYYFRELEERYTLPILPVLFIIASETLNQNQLVNYVSRKFQKS